MTKHYNTTIAEDTIRILNTKSSDTVGADVLPYLTPTIEIKRYCNIVKEFNKSNTGTSTMYTTPTDKDFYLVFTSVSGRVDAANDGTTATISATIEGVAHVVNRVFFNAGTALSDINSVHSYPLPIKIDRGTNITIALSFAAGVESFTGLIIGYTVETTKGV